MTIHIECEECEAIGSDGRVSSATVHGHIIVDTRCVSGNLGAAYMGLQLLEREKAIFEEQSAKADTAEKRTG